MPYRVQKPYVIVNGQRVFSPGVSPQQMAVCDICCELAAISTDLYTELAPDKWWRWFSYPKFACEKEAFMGCEKHPVVPKIHFLDGRFEQYTRIPLTRWQRMTEREGLIVAIILAVVFALIVGWLLK